MSYLLIGFFTGMSLIFAIGAQNIFIIEQGLKRNFIFLVCSICAISDFILIFLGIFLFHYFYDFFTPLIELLLNILLLIFLIYYIWEKVKISQKNIKLTHIYKSYSFLQIIPRTLAFTYLNPHVYSDTVFFLGNLSKNFLFKEKILFGLGASLSSVIFFFTLGYLSRYLSSYLNDVRFWKIINLMIVLFMSLLALYVLAMIFR